MAQQPDFYKIILEKNANLDDIPDKFLTGVKRSEKEIYAGLVELLNQLEIVDGRFAVTEQNIRLAAQINEQLKQVMVGSEYTRALTEFAKGFDTQAELNITYFAKAFDVTTTPTVIAAIVEQSKRNAVDLLINRAADSEFLYPIRDIVETAVVNNQTFAETLSGLREFIEGSDEVESRLMRYSRSIALDTFGIADRSVTQVYAKEYEFEWYLYSGGRMKTTRAFCRERYGKYFHIKEIELWGEGRKTPGFETPQKGSWQGRNEETNKDNILTYAGGYNCNHTIMPVSVFAVPLTDVKRAVELGYYEPDDFERRELGL